MIEAYPLQWPEGWPRTTKRETSALSKQFAKVRDELLNQIRLAGGTYPTISTNIPLRRDGLPYANQPEPVDPGVAVYFLKSDQPVSFACDRWEKVAQNMRAISKTIEAIRGCERWGSTAMMKRAYQGYAALPSGQTNIVKV